MSEKWTEFDTEGVHKAGRELVDSTIQMVKLAHEWELAEVRRAAALYGLAGGLILGCALFWLMWLVW